MIEDINRRTLGIAATILVLTTTAGLLVIGPVGIIAGPVVDRFGTQRFLPGYRSPGAPLWSAAIGGVAMIPAIASGGDAQSVAVLSALSAAMGAIILGVIALRTPLARLGAIGIGLGVAAAVVSLTLASQSG
jgi:hypothetical protein